MSNALESLNYIETLKGPNDIIVPNSSHLTVRAFYAERGMLKTPPTSQAEQSQSSKPDTTEVDTDISLGGVSGHFYSVFYGITLI